MWGPWAQLPTATKTNKTYISLKLNKLANIPSSNVESLLLLMSLEERRDSTGSDASPLNRNSDRQPPPAHCVESHSGPGGDTHSSVSAERFARSPTSSARSRLWETSLESKAAARQCWGPRQGTKSTRAHLRRSPAAASHPLSSLFPGPEVEDLNELSSGEPEAGESWPLSTPSMPCPFPSHPLPPRPAGLHHGGQASPLHTRFRAHKAAQGFPGPGAQLLPAGGWGECGTDHTNGKGALVDDPIAEQY